MGGIKGFGLGNKSWGSYRSFFGKSGYAKPRQELHHWLIHRNGPVGKNVSNQTKNQMWNLIPMNMKNPRIHQALHGKGPLKKWRIPITLHYGTPTWLKAAPGSVGLRYYLLKKED